MKIFNLPNRRQGKDLRSNDAGLTITKSRIVTVTSGKGGVGKTNFTVNLAIALSQLGQKVIIFDADLGLSNVDVLLGVATEWNLYDLLYRGLALEEILFSVPGGIRIVSGGSGFLEIANLTGEQRERLAQSLKQMDLLADYILLDTGAGISKDVLAFCTAADEVILVITPEPTSLTDAYSLIKVLDRFKLQQTVSYIINQSRYENETRATVARLEKVVHNYLAVDLNYLGSVRYDQAVINAVKRQTPFALSYPKSKAAADVQSIARSLVGQEKALSEAGDGENGLEGFINKLTRLLFK